MPKYAKYTKILVTIIITALSLTVLPIINLPQAQAAEQQANIRQQTDIKQPATQTQTAQNNQQTTTKQVTPKLADPSPAPQNVSISKGQAYNSVTIIWNAPTSPPDKYTYQVELLNNISSVVQTISNINSNTTSIDLSDLSTGNWSANVYTVTADGKSTGSLSPNPVSITLIPTPATTNFKDISKLTYNWQVAIKWAATYTITTGYPDGGFHPVTPTTRGQIASFFHKLAGNPNIEGTPTAFKDISKSVHKNDINWLSTQGITAGYTCTAIAKPVKSCAKKGDLVYYPEGKVTRVQMATFLYRFAASPTMSTGEINSYLNAFKDKAKIIASGQEAAVAFLVKNNITAGYTCTSKGKPEPECIKAGNIVFRPKYNTTRQQMALFLQKDAVTLDLTIPYLKTQSGNDESFLGVSNLIRSDITKISFQNAPPTCSNPTDVSANSDNSILACVTKSTEIIIGSNWEIKANPDSSYLFYGLYKRTRGKINLTNLNTAAITNMRAMFWKTNLPDGFSFPAKFGSVATNVSHMFQSATIPSGFTFPAGFGSVTLDMERMFWSVSLPNDFTLPAGFGSVATDMRYMFYWTTLPTNFSLPAGFGSVATDMAYMFQVATISSSFTFPAGFGSAATDMFGMFYWTTLPTNFSLPAGFGSLATKMTNMFEMYNKTSLPAGFVLPAGFGSVATNMNDMFYNVILPDGFIFPAGFGSAATDMRGMFAGTTFPAGFILPAGFGSMALDMNYMFYKVEFPNNFTFPTWFGSAALNMDNMFQNVTIPSSFTFPAEFGSAATSMQSMFSDATLNGDIDWSDTDLTNSTADNMAMFYNIVWNGHFILAQNQDSVDWLTRRTYATTDNVKVKGS
ncbi:MAG: S-layer homology domain-containing protein [Bifidobacteriaceae bacterium]|jgi:hypothetical protein|nr:S-layer homology domain-containing protein [Bifidobacteriaceae bacterium]